jgi:Protein of unknown function (DUF1326)
MITYDLKGTFYEACDCEVICPCWAGVPPDMGSCTGLFVWHIFEGEIGGVDVCDSKVIVLSSGKSCDESKYMLYRSTATIPSRFARHLNHLVPGKRCLMYSPISPQHKDSLN